MPVSEVSPETEAELLVVAVALSMAAPLTWVVLVVPDPGPTLPAGPGGVPPVGWFMGLTFVACYPVVRWFRTEGVAPDDGSLATVAGVVARVALLVGGGVLAYVLLVLGGVVPV